MAKCKYPNEVCANMTLHHGEAYCDSVPCSMKGEVSPGTSKERSKVTELIEIYPYNLASSVLEDEDGARECYVPGISAAVATLTEREQGVILMRFQQKKTLAQCGKDFGITRERVRQIEAKAIRKLRHPSRVNMMKAVPLTELQAQYSEYKKLEESYEWLKKAFETITAQPAEPGVIMAAAEMADAMKTPLENLDLSVRSYNCLRRAGKDTLGDVAEMTETELMTLRSLGRRSADEILAKLREYGLTLKYARQIEEGQQCER